jgi:2'-5' RNA ligase
MDDSVWIALFPRPEEAKLLADSYGEKAEDLHVTLAYMGKNPPISEEDLLYGLRYDLTAYHDTPETPHMATITGWAEFYGSNALVYLMGSDTLNEYGQYIREMEGADRTYSFIPHMTIKKNLFGNTRLRTPKIDTVHFDAITVMYKGNRTDIKWSW